MKGTLYGIGVGPGDPELMTLKAVRLMNACEVLAWPAPESGPGLAFQIAQPHLEAAQQEHLPLRLPISTDPFPAQEAYDQEHQSLLKNFPPVNQSPSSVKGIRCFMVPSAISLAG